jgi:hypothetical protein
MPTFASKASLVLLFLYWFCNTSLSNACSSGEFYSSSSTSCIDCNSGYYCPGDDKQYSMCNTPINFIRLLSLYLIYSVSTWVVFFFLWKFQMYTVLTWVVHFEKCFCRVFCVCFREDLWSNRMHRMPSGDQINN